MNRRFWINAAIVAISFLCSGSLAETPKVDNVTLARTLAAMSPNMTTQALSATYVRTVYASQTLQAHAEHKEAAVQRTTISELVCNTTGARESICDSRDVAGEVKQYAFHYANNGKRLQTYDSKSNRGYVRSSPQTNTNYLSLLTAPYTGTGSGRFMSRSMPVLLSRFAGATVTAESGGTAEGQTAVILEGQYKNSDPAKYFRMKALPDRGYAVAEFEEYDGKRRILTRATATGHVNLVGSLWLPRSTVLEKYTYDDHTGNSVQRSKLDILEPRIVPTEENSTFTLQFPASASIRDVTIDTDIAKLRRETDEIIDASVAKLDGLPIPEDKTGQAIIEHARQAYAAERDAAGNLNPNQQRRLELPQQSGNHYWITIPLAGLVAASLVVGGCVRRRKTRGRNAGISDQQVRKAGNA